MAETQVDARLSAVPRKPGVYLMKDEAGKVIYVGKARSLRQRLSSYFGARQDRGQKVEAMLRHVRDFSFVVCANELEAFVLESNFIKQYQPFYNILLKDDHDYPYICVTMQEAYPRIFKAYRIGADRAAGARYYGPYLNGDVTRALRTIHELFPLKTCRRVFPRDIGKGRPCLNYYIRRCVGPCSGQVSEAEYRRVMEEVCNFLEGRYSELLNGAREQMAEAARDLRFEEAALWRDRIRQLEQLQERQVATTEYKEDCDVLGLAREKDQALVARLELRQGRVQAMTSHYLAARPEESEADLLWAFMEQYYQEQQLPQRLILPRLYRDEDLAEMQAHLEFLLRCQQAREAGLLQLGAAGSSEASAASSEAPEAASRGEGLGSWMLELLEEGGGSGTAYNVRSAQTRQDQRGVSGPRRQRVYLEQPQRGDKLRLLDMARQSARENLLRRLLHKPSRLQRQTAGWTVLERVLGLGEGGLQRAEAYDIANNGNRDISCGMTVFVQGQKRPSEYRRFKLDQEEQDDYAAMAQALRRRLARLGDSRFGARPQLILLDGGRQHLAVMTEVLADFYRQSTGSAEPAITLAAMVKDEKHRTRGLVLPDGRILELAEQIAAARRPLAQSVEATAPQEAGSDLEQEAGRQGTALEAPGLDLDEARSLLEILTRIQDETHRYTGDYMRQQNLQRQTRYKLESIPGVGPVRRNKLLAAFSSLEAIRRASAEELLAAVPELGAELAQRIADFYRKEAL